MRMAGVLGLGVAVGSGPLPDSIGRVLGRLPPRPATREDLTGRARIRDAALEQFGVHGFDGATIRGIAEAAGVSSGLVQHHFGSKDALRRACDEAVLELVRRKLAATRTGQIADPAFLRRSPT
jgi:AcrR family transcriptional regulator